MNYIETYKKYYIYYVQSSHYLIQPENEWDFIQCPFSSVKEAKEYIDAM